MSKLSIVIIHRNDISKKDVDLLAHNNLSLARNGAEQAIRDRCSNKDAKIDIYELDDFLRKFNAEEITDSELYNKYLTQVYV